MDGQALQDRYAPESRCFGCGPANEQGLRIKSFVVEEEYVCDWTPREHHQAYENILNGGICGALLDCHMNWTAAHCLMEERALDAPPCTVTAEYHVKLHRPTPTRGPLRIVAKISQRSGARVSVEGTIESCGEVTATCRGVFVAVGEDHPAYHRW